MFQPEEARLKATQYIEQLHLEADLWRSLSLMRPSWRSRAAALLIAVAERLEPSSLEPHALPERLG